MNRELARSNAKQQGVALVVSLMLLLAMTLIGVSSVRSNVLQEKMVGNMADQTRAFQASEAAMHDAADWIESIPDAPVADATGSEGIWKLGSQSYEFTDADFPWASAGYAYGTHSSAAAIADLAEQPSWMVEQEGIVPDDLSNAMREGRVRYFYRVSSRGVGATTNSRSVLQTTVANRYR